MKVVEYNRNVGKRFLLCIIYISNTRVKYIYIFYLPMDPPGDKPSFNDINDFFVRKITRIRADIDATEVDDTVPTESEVGDLCTCLSLSSFCPLTESDVSALIKKSAKKSCLMDPMPTSMVVGCLDVLLPVITRIVNSSLS